MNGALLHNTLATRGPQLTGPRGLPENTPTAEYLAVAPFIMLLMDSAQRHPLWKIIRENVMTMVSVSLCNHRTEEHIYSVATHRPLNYLRAIYSFHQHLSA